jgi:hypothetical protein
MFTPEKILENYEKFKSLCEKLGDRAPQVSALLQHFEERLPLTPASSKKQYHRSTPGGLVDHSLRVLAYALKLNSTFGWGLDKQSLILSALFHDLGKVGSLTEDYYIPADEWRRNKLGETYQYNSNMDYMTVPHRSIFLLQHFGVHLKSDEMLAVLLNDGFVVDENKNYCLKEPQLATCIFTADYLATSEEKREETATAKTAV